MLFRSDFFQTLQRRHLSVSAALSEIFSSVTQAAVDLWLLLAASLATGEACTDAIEDPKYLEAIAAGKSLDSHSAPVSAMKKLLNETQSLLIAILRQWSWIYARFPTPKHFTPSTSQKCMNITQSASLLQRLGWLVHCVPVASAIHEEVSTFVSRAISGNATQIMPLVYFRGDEERLATLKIGINDPEVRIVSSVMERCVLRDGATAGRNLPKIDPASTTPAVKEDHPYRAGCLSILSWLSTHDMILSAFSRCEEWQKYSNEQRRARITKEQLKWQAQSNVLGVKRKAQRQQRKLEQREKDLKRRRLESSSRAASQKATEKGEDEDGSDNDDARTEASTTGAASTALSAVSLLSEMTSWTATGAQSVASTTLLPLLDPEEEVREHHESADGNTHLPLILLQHCISAIHDSIFREGALLAFGIEFSDEETTLLLRTALQTSSRLFTAIEELGRWSDRMALNSISSSKRAARFFSVAEDIRFNHGLGVQCLAGLHAAFILRCLGGDVIDEISTDAAVESARCRALATCLNVCDTMIPNVVSQNLDQVLKGVFSSSSPFDSAPVVYVASIIRRQGANNQLPELLDVLFGLLSDTTTDDYRTKKTQKTIAKLLLSSGSATESVATLSTALLAEVRGAARAVLDVDTLLDRLKALVNSLVEGDDESAKKPKYTHTTFLATLAVCDAVISGLQPSSVSAQTILEAMAELDVVFSLVGSQVVEGEEGAFLAGVGIAVNELTDEKKSALVDKLCRCLLSIRRAGDRCFKDLGSASLEEVVKTLESSLWQFEDGFSGLMGPSVELSSLVALGCTQQAISLALQRLALGRSMSTLLGFSDRIAKPAKKLAKKVTQLIFEECEECIDSLDSEDWLVLLHFRPEGLAAYWPSILRRVPTAGVDLLPSLLSALVADSTTSEESPRPDVLSFVKDFLLQRTAVVLNDDPEALPSISQVGQMLLRGAVSTEAVGARATTADLIQLIGKSALCCSTHKGSEPPEEYLLWCNASKSVIKTAEHDPHGTSLVVEALATIDTNLPFGGLLIAHQLAAMEKAIRKTNVTAEMSTMLRSVCSQHKWFLKKTGPSSELTQIVPKLFSTLLDANASAGCDIARIWYHSSVIGGECFRSVDGLLMGSASKLPLVRLMRVLRQPTSTTSFEFSPAELSSEGVSFLGALTELTKLKDKSLMPSLDSCLQTMMKQSLQQVRERCSHAAELFSACCAALKAVLPSPSFFTSGSAWPTVLLDALAVPLGAGVLSGPAAVAETLKMVHSLLSVFKLPLLPLFRMTLSSLVEVVQQSLLLLGGIEAARVPAVAPMCRDIYRQIAQLLNTLAAAYPKLLVQKLHLLPSILGSMTSCLHSGLVSGLLDAPCKNVYCSVLFHYSRRGVAATSSLNSSAFFAATVLRAVYTSAARTIDVVGRHAGDLDSATNDLIRIMARADNQIKIAVADPKTRSRTYTCAPRRLAGISYNELCYAAIPKSEAKALFKRAAIKIAEEQEESIGAASFGVVFEGEV